MRRILLGGRRRRGAGASALVLVTACLLSLAGCGGGGSSGTSTAGGKTSSAQGAGGAGGSEASKPGGGAHEQGAAGFEVSGGDNSIQRAGSEAEASERAAAAAALHGYLDARAATAWARACRFLTVGVSESLARLGGGKLPCPKALAALSGSLPAKARREAAIARVGAMRSQGQSGFLLFRGAGGSAYFMPMAREDGDWKVAAIAPSPLQ